MSAGFDKALNPQCLQEAVDCSDLKTQKITAVDATGLGHITAMEQRNVQEELEEQFNDVLTRLQSKELFQSDWDIASFAVFFIFVGMVLLLILLVLIRCCCCCCCDTQKPRKKKVGIDNFAMEP
ncbi:hypothetical protein AGOR_G00228620 [Albula goreensis]|uniref:Small integral membrane protein 22 n=1 Tax=Albula goreensis TaxID=1534307 RepID=A0A8T3CM95_9TELE|nr:hypothetical protein AGOR_G00228620 [Albula goreensis]